jgi:hypothetical protein
MAQQGRILRVILRSCFRWKFLRRDLSKIVGGIYRRADTTLKVGIFTESAWCVVILKREKAASISGSSLFSILVG